MLKLPTIECNQSFIKSFKNCSVDPTLPIDTFACQMKVCRFIYAKEHPAMFRIDSYLCDLLREVSNYHLEKDLYQPRQ